MKPVSFLRNNWRKKDNKPSSKSQPAPLIEPILLEAQPAAPVLRPAFSEVGSVLSLEFDSTFQDSRNNITSRVLVNGSESWELIHAQIAPTLRRQHGSLFHSSHGPPPNSSHGPPSLIIGTQSLRGGTPPHRPPRPPSLNLSSQPSSSMPRSPTRVKFAPDLHVRPSQSTSSLRAAFLRVSRPSRSSPAQEIINADALKDSDSGQDSYHPSNLSEPTAFMPYMAGPPRTAYVNPDHSEASNLRKLHHATSSTPHLPLPQEKSRRPNTEPRGSLRSSRDTIASFPQPPPLRIRKRPQPLVFLPTPTSARLPPSPLYSSNDSTPLATPTNPTPLNTLSSPKSSKFPGRLLHTVSPPAYSPPTSPLPTPPMSSGFLIPSNHDNYSGKPLRAAQSTSELRDYHFENLYTGHRATSSAPSSDLFAMNEVNRKRLPPRLTSYGSDSQSTEPDGMLSHLHEPPIHWGYAL